MSEDSKTEDHFSPYRSDGKLYGFVCVVVGATQPIGTAICEELAAHGAACIYACDMPTDPAAYLPAINAAAAQGNTKVIPYPFHLSEELILGLIDDVLNLWGRLDIWVCSSSEAGPATLTATSPADLQHCLTTTSLAPFFALKYAPAAMAKKTLKGNYPNAAPKEASYGSIIVVSTVAASKDGTRNPTDIISSSAALGVVKAGVIALRGSGIRINHISPGVISSVNSGTGPGASGDPEASAAKTFSKTSLGRIGTPQEVAKVAGFLASGFSSYVSGADIVVDGGSVAGL